MKCRYKPTEDTKQVTKTDPKTQSLAIKTVVEKGMIIAAEIKSLKANAMI